VPELTIAILFRKFSIWHASCIVIGRGPEGTLKQRQLNGATDTPPSDIAPLFSRRSDIGGGCCVWATARCSVPKTDDFVKIFSGLFLRLR